MILIRIFNLKPWVKFNTFMILSLYFPKFLFIILNIESNIEKEMAGMKMIQFKLLYGQLTVFFALGFKFMQGLNWLMILITMSKWKSYANLKNKKTKMIYWIARPKLDSLLTFGHLIIYMWVPFSLYLSNDRRLLSETN